MVEIIAMLLFGLFGLMFCVACAGCVRPQWAKVQTRKEAAKMAGTAFVLALIVSPFLPDDEPEQEQQSTAPEFYLFYDPSKETTPVGFGGTAFVDGKMDESRRESLSSVSECIRKAGITLTFSTMIDRSQAFVEEMIAEIHQRCGLVMSTKRMNKSTS